MAKVTIRYTYDDIGYRVEFDTVTKELDVVQDSSFPAPGQLVVNGVEFGQYIYSKCDGSTLDRLRFDGGSSVEYAPELNSSQCTYTPPADGTFIRNDCQGFDLYQVVANGTGGERWGALVQTNSVACGYVAPVIRGCTNPAASNYNPSATVDDGTCVLPPPPPAEYHAVGGVLPNPIEYLIDVDPLLEGLPKKNHFIRATIHRQDGTTIGTMQGRVRNGRATLDVSSYLRPLVGTEITTAPMNVFEQPGAVYPFFVRYKEHYNGLESAEVTLANPPRLAVEAAPDDYSGSLEPYVLRDNDLTSETLRPAFTTPYLNPVCFSGLPFEVSLLIDSSMAGKPMFFERRYIDAYGSELEILSTPIQPGMVGKMVRLRMDPFPLDCGWKVELSIVDEDRSYRGSCPVAEGIKIFDKSFDFTFE
ncbi:hypothetical protein [Rufibacter latericius]|uniref:Uncharacterized protein n=1 Tax=Rufibacter latericius TaxID=2487040 RepID=A0A3M9MPJ2_9BACT|nr:hypothetical protein [Rufibacter latericius]RNI26618.1 hypothetical protein EFB08_11410 [Rufibacter latericius]